MEIEYAFLAEKADRLQDGKLCIFGGDFDCLEISSFPQTIQASLVVKAMLLPSEPEDGHSIGVDVWGPDGNRFTLTAPRRINTKRNELAPNLPSGASIIIGITLLVTTSGTHILTLLLDGADVKTLPIYIQEPKPVAERN